MPALAIEPTANPIRPVLCETIDDEKLGATILVSTLQLSWANVKLGDIVIKNRKKICIIFFMFIVVV
ncbi:hypothetical protein N5J53_16725 [Empedobacter sp. GD03644]|uniref:hypothetical protein n=1 Tax=Empedobacter sp. GD03644 TaxID=2975358 RepID=UPI002446A02C|nr:hypothetical protein [Empedobacter sp. GD03644]MDH2208655.1 hypothetical protein [Empedobacter sp. GD03644]